MPLESLPLTDTDATCGYDSGADGGGTFVVKQQHLGFTSCPCKRVVPSEIMNFFSAERQQGTARDRSRFHRTAIH